MDGIRQVVNIIIPNDMSPVNNFYINGITGYPHPYVSKKYSGWNGISIDTYSEQTYLGINEYGVHYYYPILPKFNVQGKFDVQKEDGTWENNLGLMGIYLTPFGIDGRKWSEDDSIPLITPLTEGELLDSNIIDLDLSEIEDSALNDISPNTNIGILIDDYDIDYINNPIELIPEKPVIRAKIGKKDKRKPY